MSNKRTFFPIYIDSSLVEGEGMDFSELRKAVEEVELVDGHSHNIVALNSTSISGFVQAFTVGAFVDADAIAFAQTSLSFKVITSSSMLVQHLAQSLYFLVLFFCAPIYMFFFG